MTDPTYLRTILDALRSGSVHKDNASALPLSLVGLYEEALPSERNINERKMFLDFFSVWALLKKEVTVAFVLPLLKEWTEAQVIDWIAYYSKWFNSPVSGNYAIYHERLRIFILQRISHTEFSKCNHAIINRCQLALNTQYGDEWEHYALEHLSTHLLIEAMESRDGTKIKAIAYNTAHWNRQIEISKGFEWSKYLLEDMLSWASKYNEDEVIECLLQKVDLYHLEQNDAPRIVELVAQNDIETALQRIESFGGNDKEGLQRKFILYMLCLMELTLLDSQDKPFKKEAIEKLLKHLDENLPVEHSVLNWGKFLPSYLMFQMACELAEMGLEYLFIYKRNNVWKNDWVEAKDFYKDNQLEVLLAWISCIKDGYSKSDALMTMFNLMTYHKKKHEALSFKNEALECARNNSDKVKKCESLVNISIQLIKHNMTEEATCVMQEAIDCAREISSAWKVIALWSIAGGLAKLGKTEDALAYIRDIEGDYNNSRANVLLNIISELAIQGNTEKALDCAKEIGNNIYGVRALAFIFRQMSTQRKIKEAKKVIQATIMVARGLKKHSECIALTLISSELFMSGYGKKADYLIQKALECARSIDNNSKMSKARLSICKELARQGKIENLPLVIQASLETIRDIATNYERTAMLQDFSVEMAKQFNFKYTLEFIGLLDNNQVRIESLGAISEIWSKKGKTDWAINAMQKSLEYNKCTRTEKEKSDILSTIAIHLSKDNKNDDALTVSQSIFDAFYRDRSLKNMTIELAEQGKIEKAQTYASYILDNEYKSSAIAAICIELSSQGKIAAALSCTKEIRSEPYKIEALQAIFSELSGQGKAKEAAFVMHEAFECARFISCGADKIAVLTCLSSALAKQGKTEEAASAMHEAIACALAMIDEDTDKGTALEHISSELVKQGKTNEALKIARNLNFEYYKIIALKSISIELTNQGKTKEAAFIMQEALAFARCIGNDAFKSHAMTSIAIELVKKGNWTLAEQTSLEISNASDRYCCYAKMAKNAIDGYGWQKAVLNILTFKDHQARRLCLKGLTELIPADVCRKTLLLESHQYYQGDMACMENMLYYHALHELFFEDNSTEKINRFNRTLNIQWAIDIKNSLNVT